MKIIDNIKSWFASRNSNTIGYLRGYSFGNFDCGERLPFADVVFYNICDLLTDICSSVIFVNKGSQIELFAGFKTFFDSWGKLVLNLLFKQGYCVIARRKDSNYFWVMTTNEYNTSTDSRGRLHVYAIDDNVIVYVMNSQTMLLENKSDRDMLRPFLDLLDSVLNSSNTISKRMGAMVIMSPQQAGGIPVPTILTEKDRDKLEKEIGENYGSLRRQKSVLMLSNPMNVQTISLAGLDTRMVDKIKTAILAICDRIKVPANQVAIIDANSSKAFANGTELREGDIAKYRNFRRLLNITFYKMAEDLGLSVDYIIENEPSEKITI